MFQTQSTTTARRNDRLLTLRTMLLLLWGIMPTLSFLHKVPTRHDRRTAAVLSLSQVSDESSSSSSPTTAEALDILQQAELLELTLPDHRPLGCTVDESLGKRSQKLVFCSSVKSGGFAEKAGVQVGDVFVGVTGLFGSIEDVTGAGIDRVKSLVSACPDDEPLVLRLARGTPVLADHEEAIVEICSNPDKADVEVDECVVDFLREGYFNGSNNANDESDDATTLPVADDDNDMLDNMFNMWAEDLPQKPAPAEPIQPTPENTKAKPWSSRSSPSGTFVRDPRTGKMRNIDA